MTLLTAGKRKSLNGSVVFQFRTTMEGKLPQFNTRVKLPMTSDRLAVYDGKLGMSARSKENFSEQKGLEVRTRIAVADVRVVGVYKRKSRI